MKYNFLNIYIASAVFLFPLISYAAGLKDLINSAYSIVNDVLIPIAFALCVLYFFWGVAKYIGNSAGSEDAASEGKRIMIWGIVALFIVFSIWGIIYFIRGELGIAGIDSITP